MRKQIKEGVVDGGKGGVFKRTQAVKFCLEEERKDFLGYPFVFCKGFLKEEGNGYLWEEYWGCEAVYKIKGASFEMDS